MKIKEKLTHELGKADWNTLAPHAERDALFIVDRQLDLVAVGVALAEDNTEAVAHWLNTDLLKKPTAKQKTSWAKDPKVKMAKFLIIQPYVLIQMIQ